jgi:DNA-directed RNA polymerase sigma subunit (sigma70/sigma32)
MIAWLDIVKQILKTNPLAFDEILKNNRERLILELRAGADTGEKEKWEFIGNIFGIHQSTASDIFRKAKIKIKHGIEHHGKLKVANRFLAERSFEEAYRAELKNV